MRRTRNEVRVAILKACRKPLCITHIMYNANSWHGKTKDDVNWLINRKLLKKSKREKSRTLYQITPKGKAVLKCYDEYICNLTGQPKGLE